ncbi:MAG: ABC transporter ATP-binding protein [Planktomarina sp.]|nr:ABC transporter ATP-binding protein [Planktomarina sp.]MDT2034229.1 ABC transporter ATP-binding protein [Planktomarina sp.]MDT2039315.1 ABC transporter ATP-binding protein [Planktomarina sp.]MDT2049873.1 ABC transporter ATP-binding protein [Planktomarina sp.]
MSAIVSIQSVCKTYAGGLEALKGINLEIEEGEILALLGPNGAGKTTLISTICGISSLSTGKISVGGMDIEADYRKVRKMIGLVPQEITLEPFETVINSIRFSRGLFGKPKNEAYLDQVLKTLSLFDKKHARVITLSGGMKRRVLIAKALSHEPRVLFLDEPTAGVDVELRKDMWATVNKLKKQGVTIILTTHYIEEAEAIADRIAVINGGEILLVEDKDALMSRMGQKKIRIDLMVSVKKIPDKLKNYDLDLTKDGKSLTYTYDTKSERTGITGLLNDLQAAGLQMRDVQTQQSSLEDIFVGLVQENAK